MNPFLADSRKIQVELVSRILEDVLYRPDGQAYSSIIIRGQQQNFDGNGLHFIVLDPKTGNRPVAVSSVYIWLLKVKPNMVEIEGYSTSVSVPCAERWIFYVNSIQCNCRAGDWNWRTIALSNSAIFGFTFLLGRMTEVLTPDIYGAHWPVVGRTKAAWIITLSTGVG